MLIKVKKEKLIHTAPSIIRARFAPSPTGFLHLGGARTALFNWAYINHFLLNVAAGQKAELILRIEDTDILRSTGAAIDAILQAMDWLGLDYQHEVVYQTKRLNRYQEIVDEMIDKGLAYNCYASKEELDDLREMQKKRGEKPRYDRRWRNNNDTPPKGVKPVVRFANPENGVVQWQDLIKGAIAIDNAELDDFVIMRTDGVPTYNFANVVDDSDYAITHVIRGDDHVNNTPKQINIYRALGLAEPQFGHLPMIHGDDGEKLSKRHGAVNVMDYRKQGILPEALMNYLARLGFSHGDDEIFSMKQLAKWFDWSRVQSSPARFDRQKLLWLNQHYLNKMDVEAVKTLVNDIAPNTLVNAIDKINIELFVALYQERCNTVLDMVEAIKQATGEGQNSLLIYSDEAKETLIMAKDVLNFIHSHLLKNQDWSAEAHKTLFKECLKATDKKMNQLGVPLRYALLGVAQSPSVDKLLACFEPNWAMARIEQAAKL